MIKNKLFKFFLTSMCMLGLLGLNMNSLNASSFSVSANTSSVKPGNSFTVSVTVAGAGKFSIDVSNGSTSAKTIFVDGSSSFTVTAGQTGKTTVTVTAQDVTATDETPITGSRSTTVSIKVPEAPKPKPDPKPQPKPEPKPQPKPEPKPEDNRSKDNNLASLTVSEGTLSPKFSASQKSYSLHLTSDISTVRIDAKANDTKASVKGTGEKSIVIGSQTFEVVVTAENGSRKTYTITIDVAEKPTVFTKWNDQNLGLLIDMSKVKAPDGYAGENVTLEETTIQGWTNDKTGLTLVYLMDETGSKNFYIYEDGKVVRKYETVSINGKDYVLLDIPSDMQETGLTKAKVKLGDIEIDGWVYDDENHKNYSVIYLLNSQGEKVLYSYEGTEGTLQKYAPFVEESSEYPVEVYVLAATTALFAVVSLTMIIVHVRFKKKSISAIKEYYERKNQG